MSDKGCFNFTNTATALASGIIYLATDKPPADDAVAGDLGPDRRPMVVTAGMWRPLHLVEK